VLLVKAVWEGCEATARVRTPTFDATTTAAAPLDDTGTAAVGADDDVDRADAEGLTWISIWFWA
jgi:hypothetical protein